VLFAPLCGHIKVDFSKRCYRKWAIGCRPHPLNPLSRQLKASISHPDNQKGGIVKTNILHCGFNFRLMRASFIDLTEAGFS
jgi:hypothetical protein